MDRRFVGLAVSTAEPAFATDICGTIVAWNREAATLLGYSARKATGRRCYRLLAGTDLFGNSFCSAACPVLRAVRRDEQLHRFPAYLRKADGTSVCVRVSALCTPRPALGKQCVLHVLEPCVNCSETKALGDSLSATAPGNGAASGISKRELEVLGLMAQGSSTGDMSRALCISTATVRNHVQHLLDKLGAHSRLNAVCAARRQGIL